MDTRTMPDNVTSGYGPETATLKVTCICENDLTDMTQLVRWRKGDFFFVVVKDRDGTWLLWQPCSSQLPQQCQWAGRRLNCFCSGSIREARTETVITKIIGKATRNCWEHFHGNLYSSYPCQKREGAKIGNIYSYVIQYFCDLMFQGQPPSHCQVSTFMAGPRQNCEIYFRFMTPYLAGIKTL